jgi:hypothetical protein
VSPWGGQSRTGREREEKWGRGGRDGIAKGLVR